MFITILLMLSIVSIFLVCIFFLKLKRVEDEMSLKTRSIENLESLNADLQHHLNQTNMEETHPSKVVRIA